MAADEGPHRGAAVGSAPARTEEVAQLQPTRGLYAYTLGLVERDDPSALVLEMPPGGWYGRTTAVLLREMFVERRTLDAVTSLIANGLDHPNAKVRYECAHLLDAFGDDRCVQRLTRLLDDPVPRVRAIALHSLVCDACKLTPLQGRPDLLALIIEWATNDPHRRVRQEATRVLAESNQPRAVAALRNLGVKRRAPPVRRCMIWLKEARSGTRRDPPAGSKPLRIESVEQWTRSS